MTVEEQIRPAGAPGPRAIPHLSEEESRAKGKAAREKVPRDSQGVFDPGPERPDPIALLEDQATTRVPELVPIRYGRMLVSPFTFFRGAALIMASDLSTTPRSWLNAQICGDAHLSNFGVFGTPERQMVFDCNDFDETLPGPWEWDVKRLAASVVVAARYRGFSKEVRADTILGLGRVYRDAVRMMATLSNLDVWYSRVEVEPIVEMLENQASTTGSKAEVKMAATATKLIAKAHTKDSIRALDKLTHVVDGERRIVSDPPLVVPLDELFPDVQAAAMTDLFHDLVRRYRQSLATDRRQLLEQYTVSQMAAQGRRRRQRGDTGLDTAAAWFAPGGRPVPPGEGGRSIGPRALREEEPVRQPRGPGGGRPAADAGQQRHLLGLAAGGRR